MTDTTRFRAFKQLLRDSVDTHGVMHPELAQAHPCNFKDTVVRALGDNVSVPTLNWVQSLDFASWPQKPNSSTLLHGENQLKQPFGQMVAELFRRESTLLAYCQQVEKKRRELRAQQKRQNALVTSTPHMGPTTTCFANEGGTGQRILFPAQLPSTSAPMPPSIPTSVCTPPPALHGYVQSATVRSGEAERQKQLIEAHEQLQADFARSEERNAALNEELKLCKQTSTRLETEREQAEARFQTEKRKFEQLEISLDEKNATVPWTEIRTSKTGDLFSECSKRGGWTIDGPKARGDPITTIGTRVFSHNGRSAARLLHQRIRGHQSCGFLGRRTRLVHRRIIRCVCKQKTPWVLNNIVGRGLF